MSTKLNEILIFLEYCYNNQVTKRGRGKPCTYSKASMTLFFIVMLVKKVHTFQGMEKQAAVHFGLYGFPKGPSRKTLKRWFMLQAECIHYLMPQVAEICYKKSPLTFRLNWGFVDKSVFRALGGVWHKKHMIAGIIPHKSIDTAASWAKSAYHNWRFGYGLHVICLQNRFPISACVTTAATKDYSLLDTLLTFLKYRIGVLVGDKGYWCLKIIRELWQNNIMLVTPNLIQSKLKKDCNWLETYNDLKKTAQARLLYNRRKPSIEPLFSLIKTVFDLQHDNQLPYKGLEKNNSFLMIATMAIQLMMYQNFVNNRDLGNTNAFLTAFK